MNLDSNPITLFNEWFKEAESSKIKEFNAMNLATADSKGAPSNRTVLLKGYDEKGFVFYTNLESRKGGELKSNPLAALCFYWKELDRQVRIEGKVQKVSDEEADEYFNSRPLQSRIGTHLSKQSQIITGDFDLAKAVAQKTLELVGKKVERPESWSGFCVIPEKIEFWQKGDFRIHKRRLYCLCDGKWEMKFLYP